MLKPFLKTVILSFASLFLFIASHSSYANGVCANAYQWTPSGSFKLADLVRYKGYAYFQKSVIRTQGVHPDINPNDWTFIAACSANATASCDFNGDGKMDIARGFAIVDMVGGLISNTENTLRENANLTDTGEITITYNDNYASAKPADLVLNQNNLGMGSNASKNAWFGLALSAGDFNNDTFCDLAIGAPGFTNDTAQRDKGTMNVLYGSPNGLSTMNAQRFDQDSPNVPDTAEIGDRFGSTLRKGDFNGDGYDDIAIGSPGESVTWVPQLGEAKNVGFFHVLYGSRNGIQTNNPKAVGYFQHISGVPINESEKDDRYGNALAAADFDKDGYIDLVVVATGEDNQKGKISVFRGSPRGIDVTSRLDITQNMLVPGPTTQINQFGRNTNTYDANNDGFPDLIIFDQIGDENIHYFIPGSASGLMPVNFWFRRFICNDTGCTEQ